MLRVYSCTLPRTNIVMPGLSDGLEKSRTIWGSLYRPVKSACGPAPGVSCSQFSFRLTPDFLLAVLAPPLGRRCRRQAKTNSPPSPPPLPGSPWPLFPCRPRDADAVVAPAPSLMSRPSISAAFALSAVIAVVWVAVDKRLIVGYFWGANCSSAG